ncbi:MAG: hypothetical protein JRF30_06160 [Deltaproteobacteria bacterium]|nr:hypothetical protein [Deltaproteobacteria bacterium]
MMNIPSIRDRSRLVEMLKASHADIEKPAMSEPQKRADIDRRYPSWNAVKRVIIISKATSRRFCGLLLFISLAIFYQFLPVSK